MEQSLKKFPIAEIFTSWQGEGLWAGTRMTFIRFAGCNVGKQIPTLPNNNGLPETIKGTSYGAIPIWQEECTSWDGRKFLCDTDFRKKEFLTIREILSRVPKDVYHVCITGGEPLLHDLKPLLIQGIGKIFHIETSGTRQFPSGLPTYDDVWVTVSPKFGCSTEMIQRANEIKLLVDEQFNEEKAAAITDMADEECIVWLSSINGVDFLDKENMDRCKEILERHPDWRLTQQAHKLWNVR